jgi:hypothetical protein
MEAAHVTWRPLGELFVERRLITSEELEEALLEQRATGRRLGAILVDRGLVSSPELTNVLVNQLGNELTRESGFGSGLWDEIRRRHPRTPGRAPGHVDEMVEPAETVELATFAAVEPEPEPGAPQVVADPWSTGEQPDDLAWQIEHRHTEVERTAGAALVEQQLRDEVQEMRERVAALESALDNERATREAALDDLAAAPSPNGAQLDGLVRQTDQLRAQVDVAASAVTAEQQLRAEMQELHSSVATLEAALSEERAAHRSALDELADARTEAGEQATELRLSLERLHAELARANAATSWLEYWSGARTPNAPLST